MPSVFDVSDLCVSFGPKGRMTEVVRNVSLSIREGEILGLVGESGSGKSVTCRSLMGLLSDVSTRSTSRVRSLRDWDGTPIDLNACSPEEMRHIRGKKISMIFQEPLSALNPTMKVGRQIAEMLEIHDGISARAARSAAIDLIARMGITEPDRRAENYPFELSGGMCQRIVIAMALSCKPRLLIADEPTTALDVTVQQQILDLIRDLRDERGMSVIFVSHDLGVVRQLTDTVAVMYCGEIVEKTSTAELMSKPRHPYSHALLQSKQALDINAPPGMELSPIPGVPANPRARPEGCSFQPRCPVARVPQCNVAPSLTSVSSRHEVSCHRWEDLEAEAMVS